MPDLGQRIDTAEMMDDPTLGREEFLKAYNELGTINQYLGGVRAVQRFLPPPTKRPAPTKGPPRTKRPAATRGLVLDVAAGACDIGDRLTESGRWQVVGLDLNSAGLSLARRTFPVVGDAFNLPFADNTFDCVTASLFFHHLSDADCSRILRGMFRVARRRVIVNDLHRAQAAYWSIYALTRLLGSSPMVQNDGPLSVRRAFRPEELIALARRAGFEGRVYRSFPYRLVLIVDK